MKIRVLLVDDEKDFIETLAQRLEARNLHVAAVSSGDEAVKRLEEEDFDVVVVDLLMPGKDGIETMRELKRVKPLVEVILLTGHATVETAVTGMQLGAFYYLMKPTDIKRLLENIARAFQRKSEHEERIRQAEIERLLRS